MEAYAAKTEYPDRNPNAGYIGRTAGEVRVDGLNECLNRMLGLCASFHETAGNFEAIANRLGGSDIPLNAMKGPDSPEPPVPEVALFKARAIEQGLSRILDRMRQQANRMDTALS